MRDKKQCKNCRYLYTKYGGFGNCWNEGKSSGPGKKACRRFEHGPPFVPALRGRLAKVMKFDPEVPQSWIWYHHPRQALVLVWTTDPAGRPCWELKLIGLKPEGGMYSKQFKVERPAFYGEVNVLGAGQTSLWTSFGFEDTDEVDEDGIVKNKPRVVRLYPVEERPTKKGGHNSHA